MSTYVELCRLCAQEADLAGASTFVAVENLSDGDFADVSRWVRNSYVDIQNRNGGFWRWLSRPFTLQTVASQGSYGYAAADDITGVAPGVAGKIDRFNAWDLTNLVNPPSIYLTSTGVAGERQLVWLPYDLYQRLFQFGAQNAQSPVYISIDEQDQIVLGPVPNDIFTVRGRYWRGPQLLTLSGETPEMPAQYHDLIAYYALKRYAFKNVAPEALSNAQDQIRRYLIAMESKQLGEFTFAAALQ